MYGGSVRMRPAMAEKPTCYFVSLKYAPGLWKEFHLLGRNLRDHGYAVKYLISRDYAWMTQAAAPDVVFVSSSANPKEILVDVARYRFHTRRLCARAFQSAPPAFLCVYNPHPLNAAVLRLAKRFAPNGIRAVYLHEPARPGKQAYGWKGRLFFDIVEHTQKRALATATDVLLPSPVAQQLFQQRFPRHAGRRHLTPILIPDRPCRPAAPRRYFSMVGRFNFAKRLDLFIEAANYAAERDDTLHFQIATASPIDEYLKALTPAARSHMRVVRKDRLSDDEISEHVAASFAVLCLQPMITQSGVAPVAFMNATPVIARSLPGFTQFVRHQSNGWILPDGFSARDVLEAMNNVRANVETLSANARCSYLDWFSEANWERDYAWLLEALAGL